MRIGEERRLLREQLRMAERIRSRIEWQIKGLQHKLQLLDTLVTDLKTVLDTPDGRWERRKVIVRA